MEILRRLSRIQHDRGYIDDTTLAELARELGEPLYRLEGLVSFYTSFRRTPPPRVIVQVCRDVSCNLSDRSQTLATLGKHFQAHEDVEIVATSCLGRCDAAPALTINDVPTAPHTGDDLESLEALIQDPPSLVRSQSADGFRCDPYSDPSGHYGTLRTLLRDAESVGENCVDRLTESGLRGMGGAGFPTGRKWGLVRDEVSDQKYVICNADESEPGTFKDRAILASLPHLVVEGMILAGLTIGADKGIVYLRHEYGPERIALLAAIAAAEEQGLLGDNIGGIGRSFQIEIFDSPGGYILGEETALLEALEDKRGEPRLKPPYPGTHGLWGKPTLINNVESFALATSIIHYGVPWWNDQGHGEFKGLKFVSVSGDVNTPGAFEIPLGITVRELIEIAGGMKGDKPLKAFLPGGASSKFLPADRVDTAVDFDAMQQAGTMLGTGALIVLADDRDLFSVATNIVRFFRNESCGKCVPCRVGTEKTTELLERVRDGSESSSELNVIDDLCSTLEQTSICGLGQVALTPIASMMELFPQDIPNAND